MSLHRSELFMQGAVGFSNSAQLVINRLTAPSVSFQNAIAIFVDANVLNGNWPDADNPGSGLIDEFYYAGGVDVSLANSLIGWIAKTATNNGATKVNQGWGLNGINQYIDTNWVPLVDTNNYTLNDAGADAYVYSNDNTGNSALFSALTGGDVQKMAIIYNARYAINSSTTCGTGIPPALTGGNLWSIVRNEGTLSRLYKNGVLNIQVPRPSTVLPSDSFRIGNYFGVFHDGIISCMAIRADIGFDHAGFNTSLNTLLTTMGVLP